MEEIKEILKKEIDRLVEDNNSLQNTDDINKNILTMCEIAKTLKIISNDELSEKLLNQINKSLAKNF